MAASLPTSLKWNNGEPKLSLLIPTHLGSARKTNGTTACSAEDILSAADELNGRPRKKLGYRTPEELFDAFLDAVFAA